MSATTTDHGAALADLGTATIGESGGIAMAARIGPVWTGATVSAPAYPVSCPAGDNLAVHAAVAAAPAGSVLVVDVGSTYELGYFGEVLATGAQARGLTGLVIDGCVRDLARLEKLGFPVFAHGTALPGASKSGPGSIGTEARVGGVQVGAGDWIVGDVDGVVVVPQVSIDEVLKAARGREAREETMFDELRHGSTTVDLLGLDIASVHDDVAHLHTGRAGAVYTASAPVPSGGYAQARWAGDTLYLAGVGPYDPVSRTVVGADIAAQTAQTLSNAQATLKAAGLDFADVISTTAFLADLDRDWRGFDEAYSRALSDPYPARATVGAQLKGILVELVMVARARR